ncbi:ATP-grasp domain-containing protein [Geminocystis sp. NIES-3709]|uniref:ATP-grasp domain-containing protein n=1 Tax=Geminocystis sp. NIES-3709 TaxID=1617448 RepID=UPI0005FC47D6|nr:ATP-grasp domain-containing protein [Geminocystis sp. NIES-3709]BAQ64396.1 succinyl-CoA ligase [ADP-forming] beta chain [Geminocystis sp. NIES-3709]
MDLLEYQAKLLFQQVGIPVLPSQSISHARELKNLLIPYPIVLKSQVLASGRALVGGVKFVENTIDAIAASQFIFNLPIEGEYPEVILAEARYDAENELFLAIMLDYSVKKPVLLGSAYGGININILLENLQTGVIDGAFSPFYARRLVKQMGLTGNAIASVSKIIEKMYHLFMEYDLDAIEINPLGVNSNGEVMALDGKIRINDHALNRHPKLLTSLTRENIKDIHNHSLSENIEEKKATYSCIKLDINSNLAVISNSIDLGIFTINSLANQEQKIHSYYLISSENKEIQEENLNSIFSDIFNTEQIKVVLINIINQWNLSDFFVQKMGQFYQKEMIKKLSRSEDRADRATGLRFVQTNTKNKSSQPIRKIEWILRTPSPNCLIDKEQLKGLPCQVINDFESSIKASIKHSKLETNDEEKVH